MTGCKNENYSSDSISIDSTESSKSSDESVEDSKESSISIGSPTSSDSEVTGSADSTDSSDAKESIEVSLPSENTEKSSEPTDWVEVLVGNDTSPFGWKNQLLYVSRSFLLRESVLDGLYELKSKYRIPIYLLVNIAIRNVLIDEDLL